MTGAAPKSDPGAEVEAGVNAGGGHAEGRRPRVSIGLPVFNGARYLEETARSVLDQTYRDLELVISDNASTDETPEICRRLALEDPRVRYERADENLGAAPNYNRLVELARGEFFKWAPHDDPLAPTLVERFVEELDARPDASLVYARAVRINEAGHQVGQDTFSVATDAASPARRAAHVIANVSMATPVVGLTRLDALRRTRLIASFPASDYVLLAELALRGAIVEHPEPLMRRRVHDQTSRKVHVTKRAAQRWFDPSRKSWPLLTIKQRLMLEYARSGWRLGDGVPQKAWTAFEMMRAYCAKRLRVTVGGVRRRFQTSTAPSM